MDIASLPRSFLHLHNHLEKSLGIKKSRGFPRGRRKELLLSKKKKKIEEKSARKAIPNQIPSEESVGAYSWGWKTVGRKGGLSIDRCSSSRGGIRCVQNSGSACLVKLGWDRSIEKFRPRPPFFFLLWTPAVCIYTHIHVYTSFYTYSFPNDRTAQGFELPLCSRGNWVSDSFRSGHAGCKFKALRLFTIILGGDKMDRCFFSLPLVFSIRFLDAFNSTKSQTENENKSQHESRYKYRNRCDCTWTIILFFSFETILL